MRRLLTLLTLLSSVACFTPDTVPQPRWFRPQLTRVESADAAPDAPDLRLALVTANQHLRERIAWRSNGVEYGYYELARWTDTPSEVVTDAVQAAVYGTGRVRRSVSGTVPTLYVQVRAFEEVITADGEHVEVELLAVLESPDGDAFFDQVLTASAPIDGDPITTARELGAVTSKLADQLSVAVAAALTTWKAAQG